MAGLPEPEVGLVISYSTSGGRKRSKAWLREDRPCAMVLTVEVPAAESDRRKQVAVVPITQAVG